MPKLTPARTFLLRQIDVEGGKKKDVVARKGVRIDVTEAEWKRLPSYFVEQQPRKGAVSVK